MESTKFRVSEKTPETFKERIKNKNIFSQLRLYDKNCCTEVLQSTEFSSNTRACYINSFVGTVLQCYNNHYNLVIRPDDIWTSIITQFSFYITANAEKYQKEFVNFEGKKELTVTVNGVLREAPYDMFVSMITEKINENLVDKDMKSWILPNFTTTKNDDLIACGIVFMATMKKYFDYTCCLECGIPWITLEGTLGDWQNVLQRLQKLKSFGLEKWFNLLEPIIKQFISAKQGDVDLNFWQKICHRHNGGSGPDYLSGWISVFCVFDINGKWQASDEIWLRGKKAPKETWPYIDIAEIPPGVVEADVKIIDVGSTEYHSVLLAGHMAYEILEECTLKPKIGWAIALKPCPNECALKEKLKKLEW